MHRKKTSAEELVHRDFRKTSCLVRNLRDTIFRVYLGLFIRVLLLSGRMHRSGCIERPSCDPPRQYRQRASAQLQRHKTYVLPSPPLLACFRLRLRTYQLRRQALAGRCLISSTYLRLALRILSTPRFIVRERRPTNRWRNAQLIRAEQPGKASSIGARLIEARACNAHPLVAATYILSDTREEKTASFVEHGQRTTDAEALRIRKIAV
jgi:hypothetical protein